jgi:2,3-dihydroxy-p-cumate/2,3-dihydroxybenzoate 3,4-dioxygenase
MNPPFLYDKLSYVALGTTDLDRAIDYYQQLVGLELTTDDSPRRASFRCSEQATNVALYQRDQAGLLSIGFKLQSAAESAKARAHFEKLGYSIDAIEESERSFLKIGDAFRVFEPTSGLSFDFFHDMTIPAWDFAGQLTHIERLGHVVLRTTKLEKIWPIMEKDFGFVASDYVEDKAVWMRCYPNRFHHSIAFVQSSSEGLHHVNFMVHEIDDVGRARNRFINADVNIVYGPGRHKPSGSVFLYFTDPDGMTMEYSFGMEEFPAEDARQPRMLMNSPEVMDQWGGLPKPEFGANGSIIKP